MKFHVSASLLGVASAALVAIPVASVAGGDTVKVTPLGSNDGEFCARDRALVFEDPNGTRILYDPGRTVNGAGDPRLGDIHVVLLSSVHDDHIGDRVVSGGPCANPTTIRANIANSNTAEIIAGTGAVAFEGGEMTSFLGNKVVDAGGQASQVQVLRPGGKRILNGIEFATVMALHSNGINPLYLQDPAFQGGLSADGLTAYAGPDHGYIVKFTNGLVAYLTADTGQVSDMRLIVRDYYRPKLAVVNMGGTFSMGSEEAAFAVNRLIEPRSVIAEHANEEATVGGKLIPGTRTAQFLSLLKGIRGHVPTSGRTMEFDSSGKCVAGAC